MTGNHTIAQDTPIVAVHLAINKNNVIHAPRLIIILKLNLGVIWDSNPCVSIVLAPQASDIDH